MHVRRFDILATMALVAWLVLIVSLTFYGRRAALDTLATPEAQAEWQHWREDVKTLNENGPVKRREPKSVDPPALVMMRDRFGVVLVAGLVFGTLLFAAVALPLRGVLRGRQALPSTSTDVSPGS